MTMRVSEDQVATLRAYLAGQFDEYERRSQNLDRDAAWAGYMALLEAAFFKAVDRRFGTTAEDTDVIEFVANVRARTEQIGEAIDPRMAERLINAALGRGEVGDIDDKTRFGTETVLLAALIAREQFDDAALDGFMAKARALVES